MTSHLPWLFTKAGLTLHKCKCAWRFANQVGDFSKTESQGQGPRLDLQGQGQGLDPQGQGLEISP